MSADEQYARLLRTRDTYETEIMEVLGEIVVELREKVATDPEFTAEMMASQIRERAEHVRHDAWFLAKQRLRIAIVAGCSAEQQREVSRYVMGTPAEGNAFEEFCREPRG